MAYQVKQMENLAGTMPIAQIPQYISKLGVEKKKISEDIDELKTKELDMKVKVDILKEKEKDLGEEFQEFVDIKLELKKYGLDINDLESFGQTVKQAHELGYDAHLIVSKLRYWDDLEKKELDLEESVLK